MQAVNKKLLKLLFYFYIARKLQQEMNKIRSIKFLANHQQFLQKIKFVIFLAT